MKCVFILLCFYAFGNAATENVYVSRKAKHNSKYALAYFQRIREGLVTQNWKDDEEPCSRQLIRIVENVQNSTLWATWIWDSMQQPVGQLYGTAIHLGNYDQCLDLPWDQHPEFRTQYCLAEVEISEVDDRIRNVDLFGPVQRHLKSKTKHNLIYNKFAWGICAPAVCKPHSVAKFVNVLFRGTHLGLVENQINVSVNPEYCQVSGESLGGTLGFYLVIFFIMFLSVLTLVCSYVNSNGMKSTIRGLNIAKAFDIKANAESLMKNTEDHLKSLLGIRFYSTIITLGGHYWLLKIFFGTHNAGRVNKLYDTSILTMIFNLEMFIDTFIMISGLLLINGLMHNGVKPFSPLKVIVKRYIRFMWPILVMLMVLPHAYFPGNPGPLTRRFFKDEIDCCSKNWWKIILMIANYSDPERICYPVLWSVSCDFHLSVFGILIYWVYVKDKRSGLQVFAACASAAFFMPFIYAYVYGSAPVNSFDLRITTNYRKHIMANPMYIWSHLRAGAYFVGMAVGFLFAIYKPAKYRNVISKKWSILAFCIFLALFALVNFLTYAYQWRKCGDLERSLFAVLRRITWASLIGLIIIICEYGTLPLLPDFLSWSAYVPLSKLSYGVFLTHFIILERYLSETRVPLRQGFFDDIVVLIGVSVISMLISLLMWIFVESPVLNLLYILLSRSKSTQNGDIVTNKQKENHAESEHNIKKIS